MERLELFKAELQRAHCPAVMTVAAPEVEAACARNGLSLAEILRPFGIIRQLNGTVGGEQWARALIPKLTAAAVSSNELRPGNADVPWLQCRYARRRSTRCAFTAGGCDFTHPTRCSSRPPMLRMRTCGVCCPAQLQVLQAATCPSCRSC